MKNWIRLAVVACMAAGLTACGGGDGGSTATVATGNLSADINPATGTQLIQVFDNTTLDFQGGVDEFGTNGATTVTIGNTGGGAPTFVIAAGGNTASGELGFGSCKFTIRTSTFTSGPLVVGQTIIVTPCRVEGDTAGKSANGVPASTAVRLRLNRQTSVSVQKTLIIQPSGAVQIVGPNGNLVTIGSVPAGTATGSISL